MANVCIIDLQHTIHDVDLVSKRNNLGTDFQCVFAFMYYYIHIYQFQEWNKNSDSSSRKRKKVTRSECAEGNSRIS